MSVSDLTKMSHFLPKQCGNMKGLRDYQDRSSGLNIHSESKCILKDEKSQRNESMVMILTHLPWIRKNGRYTNLCLDKQDSSGQESA